MEIDSKCISFVLEQQVTQKTNIIKADIPIIKSMADLSSLFSQIPQYQFMVFQIYSYEDKKYFPLLDYILTNDQNKVFIPSKMLSQQIILFKFILETTNPKSKTNLKISKDKSDSSKKPRSKERTIMEVIQLVKTWRKMHEGMNGKKGNLNEIAQVLGISKKSLDDYYYQLKLGEKYEFNFVGNLGKKIGVLRNFIKQFKPSKSQRQAMSQKHPKDLKIIEQIQSLTYKFQVPKKTERTKESFSLNYDIKTENHKANAIFYESEEKQCNQKDNEFYNEFGFMVEEGMYPFLKLEPKVEKKNAENFDGEFFC